MIETAIPMPDADTKDIRATLFYAGKIQGRGRFDAIEPERTNLRFEPFETTIHDARPSLADLTLEKAGFTFAKHDHPSARDEELFISNLVYREAPSRAATAYQDAVAEFLRDMTDAKAVCPQLGGTVARTSNRAKTKSWALPANFVHLDFTADSARKFLHWSVSEEQLSQLRYSRFVVYQTWRALSPPPQDNVLAICDGSTISEADGTVIDSVVAGEDVPGGKFESRLCKASASHRWYYLSDMNVDDLLIFKGFDSAIPRSMNAMHTAFDNPVADEDAEPRRSVEARFFAFYD